MPYNHSNLPPVGSDQLVEAFRRGDVDAFEQWYRLLFVPLTKFARQLCGSTDLAHDLVQDVFVSIWTRRAEFNIATSTAAYMYGAVRRRVLQEHRHLAVVQRSEKIAESTGVTFGLGEAPASPDQLTENSAVRTKIVAAINALPQRQRLALTLWLEHDLSTAEIAKALDISDRVARRLLEKARNGIREALADLVVES